MPRISRHDSQELTRRRLRDAARAEFLQHGVAASSIDRITAAAGYSRGAFYANHRSKFELALDLFNEYCREAIGAWQSLIDQATDPQALLHALEQHYERVFAEQVWWRLSVELRLEADRDPAFRQVHDAAEVGLIDHLRAMVSHLCRYARCGPDIDPEYIALMLHAASHGLPFERARLAAQGVTAGQMLNRLLLDLMGRPARLTRAARAA